MNGPLFSSRGPSHPRSLNIHGSHDALLKKPKRSQTRQPRAVADTRPTGSKAERQAWMRERAQERQRQLLIARGSGA